MCVELNGKVWKKFVEFFREEKGYTDWTEQEIEDSRNDDDITEFLGWLVNQLESDEIKDALSMYIDYLRDGDEDDQQRAKRADELYSKITGLVPRAYKEQ